jgi:predicted transcriptional regulator
MVGQELADICRTPSPLNYEACAKEGFTQAETARVLGVSREAVRQHANRYGLTFKQGRQRGVPVLRYDTMTLYAESLGVSPQAVSQAYKRG